LYHFFGVTGAFYALVVSPIFPVILLGVLLSQKKLYSFVKELRFIWMVLVGVLAGFMMEKILIYIFH
jgi:hypothetical protein